MRPLPLLLALAVVAAAPSAAHAAGPALHGTVTDDGGTPLAHILVTARAGEAPARTTLTDADGRYALADPTPGTWAMRFDPTPESALVTGAGRGAPGFGPADGPGVTVPDDGDVEVDQVLPPGGGIAGVVRADDGADVGPDLAVRATVLAGVQSGPDAWDAARRPDRYAHGQYAILGLAPGRYDVALETPRGDAYPLLRRWFGGPAAPLGVDLWEDAVEVEVRAGEVTPDVSGTLTRSGRVAGRVVDATGAPMAGAFVQGRRLDSTNGRPVFGDLLSGTTDDAGRYDLGPAHPGQWELCASSGPCDPAHRAVVRISASGTATAADVSPFSTPIPPPTPVPFTPTTPTAPPPIPTAPASSTEAAPPTPTTTAATTPAPTTTATAPRAPVLPTPSAPAPGTTPAVPALELAVASGSAPVVTVRLPRAGTLTARMTARGALLARAATTRTTAGRARLRLALTRAGRAAVRRHAATRAVVRVTFRPRTGAPTSASRTTTLRGRR